MLRQGVRRGKVAPTMTVMGMMRPRRTITLFRFRGIAVTVGWSWFAALFIYLLLLAPYFHTVLRGSYTTAYVATVIGVFGFFGSLIAHEFGHALTATRKGVAVVRIELWALGGLTLTAPREPLAPATQLQIALAGPAVSALIFALTTALGLALVPSHTFLALAIGEGPHASFAVALLAFLAALNGLLLGINLIPAFPLDGGQILQSLVALLSGRPAAGLRLTGLVGQLLALLAGVVAFYLITRGYLEGWFLLILGIALFQSASVAAVQGRVASRVSRLRVADVLNRAPVLVPGNLSVLEVWERFFGSSGQGWLAVTDQDHHFLGAVRGERLAQEVAAGRPALPVVEVAEGETELLFTLDDQQRLEPLLQRPSLRRWGGLVAVDRDGAVVGVLTLAQLQEALSR